MLPLCFLGGFLRLGTLLDLGEMFLSLQHSPFSPDCTAKSLQLCSLEVPSFSLLLQKKSFEFQFCHSHHLGLRHCFGFAFPRYHDQVHLRLCVPRFQVQFCHNSVWCSCAQGIARGRQRSRSRYRLSHVMKVCPSVEKLTLKSPPKIKCCLISRA